MGRAGRRKPSDAITVGMAIGLFIASGVAVLGTGRSVEDGIIDPAGRSMADTASSAFAYDPWLAPAESSVDHLALHAVAGPRMADGMAPVASRADRDPFWALTSRTDPPAPFVPAAPDR